MGTMAGLRLLARQPTWRWWTLGSFLARLPLTMSLIALVLLGESVTGSVAVGAQLSGVAVLASGLSALWRGRLLDRSELTSGLRRDCLLTALALLCLAAAAAAHAPLTALFALAALLGLAMAALSGGFRALLQVVVTHADIPRASAIEAVFVELAFVTGPALAGVLVLLVGPVGALLAMALAATGGALIVSRLPALHPPEERAGFAPWRMPGVRPVLLLALCMGATVGMFESLVPARVEALGADPGLAGPLLGLVALGSAMGGLAASARAEAVSDVRRPAALLLLAFAAVLMPSAVAPSLVLLGGALLLAGVPIAPLNALGMIRLHGIVPRGRQAEGFSVYIAAVMIGAGAGQSVVGQLLPWLGSEMMLMTTGVVPLAAGSAVVAAVALRRSGADIRPLPSDPAR